MAALGLNYESLKKRLLEANSREHAQVSADGAFVELTGAQLLGPEISGTVVEVSDAVGGRLTVRLGAGSALDVARLVVAFRGRPL